VTSVPEPGTLSLLGAGLLAGWLGGRRQLRKQQKSPA
jgi:PEP-CTERM motif-containing protein